ncbi:receptor-like kinase, partial [Trifolium medium]|nr:receptor-like kinase [Trifolium medium]
MTNSFKDKLGQGGFGVVYKGKLFNDCPVAVKILSRSKGNGEEFINEISDFGLAKLCLRKESIISMSDARGTMGLELGSDLRPDGIMDTEEDEIARRMIIV